MKLGFRYKRKDAGVLSYMHLLGPGDVAQQVIAAVAGLFLLQKHGKPHLAAGRLGVQPQQFPEWVFSVGVHAKR